MSTIIKIEDANCRLVGGHPMVWRERKDQRGNVLKKETGEVRQNVYIGFAVPKRGETDWKQTAWGQQIVAVAQSAFPNGEMNRGDFSWKIEDGDSAVPNKANRRPCDQEGYPDHWIIKASTEFQAPRCFHIGKYDPMDQIQNKAEIKTGDYGYLAISVAGNENQQNPGVYINPEIFVLTNQGKEIVIEGGPSAAELFGGGAPAPAPQAAPAPAPVPQAAPPVQPATDLVQPGYTPPPAAPAQPQNVNFNGQIFSVAALKAAGWTDEQIATNTTPV